MISNKTKYTFVVLAASLAGCSNEFYDTLSGTPDKTPLQITTSLNLNSSVSTRAVNKEFQANDEFFACLRHVIDNNNGTYTEVNTPNETSPSADFHPRAYATFKVNANPSATDNNGINVYDYGTDFSLTSLKYGETTLNANTNPVAALYWDDFSTSTSDATDLRTANHKLQSYYAYCFNGASAGAEGQYTLTENTGSLSWKIRSDQRELANFTKSDLLWSTPQSGVAYGHKSSVDDASRDGLVIPFTHALSKISVNVFVDTDAGFVSSDNLFNNVDVVLSAFRTSCTLNPTAASNLISFSSDDNANVTMRQVSKTNTSGSYEAIVVPSLLTLNNLFATIVVDGNNYNIPVSASMLQEATADNSNKGWGKKLTESSDSYQMQQGVNYVLDVTLKKTKIGVRAQIKDWDAVLADGQGDINFTDDVTEIDITVTTDENLISFDLWRSIYNEEDNSFRDYDEDNTEDGIDKATTTTVTTTNGNTVFTNNPEIYWLNGSTSYFFRALSKKDAETGKFVSVENSFDAAHGIDLLWGTTAAHKDKNNNEISYDEGVPINPRTGPVPMIFKHAMSKISVELKTSTSDNGTIPADAVDLAGATISIANIYDKGTIELEDGDISALGFKDNNEVVPIKDVLIDNAKNIVVLPQSLIYTAGGTTDEYKRTGAVAFYNKNELETIGDKTYVKSTLNKEAYTAEDANAYNATLDGAVTTDDVKTPAVKYTAEEAIDYNATLDGAVKEGDNKYYTYEEFIAITNKNISQDLFNNVLSDDKKKHTYTYDEYKQLEGNSEVTYEVFEELTEEQKTKVYTYEEYKALDQQKPFASYSIDQFNTINKEYLKNGTYTEGEAIAYNAKLPGAKKVDDEKTPAVLYTEDEANAYNANLTGAVTVGDVWYSLKEGAKEAEPGDLKTNEANPKIVMLITLKDGTTYTLDLASCTTTVDGQVKNVDTWERGTHYTYSIMLQKEKVSLRAMVKDWEEKTGGGNANLDWD